MINNPPLHPTFIILNLPSLYVSAEPRDSLGFTFGLGIPTGLDLITLMPAEKEYDYSKFRTPQAWNSLADEMVRIGQSALHAEHLDEDFVLSGDVAPPSPYRPVVVTWQVADMSLADFGRKE